MRYKADLTVKVMAETAYLAENALAYPSVFDQLRQLTPRPTETAETLAMSAVAASIEQSAGAIIVLSTSGISARFLSKFRPQCPIICGTSLLPSLFMKERLIRSHSKRADCPTTPPLPRCLPCPLPRTKGCTRGSMAD
jgi:pyruvate kinase